MGCRLRGVLKDHDVRRAETDEFLSALGVDLAGFVSVSVSVTMTDYFTVGAIAMR